MKKPAAFDWRETGAKRQTRLRVIAFAGNQIVSRVPRVGRRRLCCAHRVPRFHASGVRRLDRD